MLFEWQSRIHLVPLPLPDPKANYLEGNNIPIVKYITHGIAGIVLEISARYSLHDWKRHRYPHGMYTYIHAIDVTHSLSMGPLNIFEVREAITEA